MERKHKLSYIYSRCGKIFEEELSFEKFYKSFSDCINEYEFLYKDLTIFLAFHIERQKKVVYELNIIDKLNNTNNYEFLNIDELLNAKVINSHSLIDIWDHLTN